MNDKALAPAGHSHDHGSMVHSHSSIQHDEGDEVILSLKWAFVGIGLLINSFVLEKFFFLDDASFVCGLASALILTVPIIIKAVQDIINGHYHMNELVAIAVASCLTLEDFRSAGVVAFFMILADIVEHRTASGARSAIEGLLKLAPEKGRKIVDGKEVEVEASELKRDDLIIVRPGEQIPADGIIQEGVSVINQANITGESLPVDKAVGDGVFAGTSNLSGVLRIKVTEIGEKTTLGKVKDLITKAQQTRLPIMSVIDRYIGWYTPSVLMIAIIVLFITQKLEPSITILILSCPCAIILATPTAMVAAISAASRVGILIKDVKDFERAAEVTSIVFDKTGTLTTGELKVAKMNPVEGIEAGYLLQMAGSIESNSTHPVAKAITEVTREARLPLLDTTKVSEDAGKGVRGEVDGHTVLVGRKTWLAENGIVCEMESDEHLSAIHVSMDGKEIGWIGLSDQTRGQAKNAINELRGLNFRNICLLTGDRESVARKVSGELGCDDMAFEVLPEEKLEYVKALKNKGEKVVVVGDGVNDAAALAAGDLGVAMASGSDVAIGSSSVAMMTEDLNRIPFLIRLARKTRFIVYQNLLFGFLFIFVVSGFAILEYVDPIVGGILHFLSSFIVIFNSFRIVKMSEEFTPFQQTKGLQRTEFQEGD